jgi:hypothetical protein
MHPQVYFQNDRNDIFEIFPAEMEKLFLGLHETQIAIASCSGACDGAGRICIGIQNQNNVSFHKLLLSISG